LRRHREERGRHLDLWLRDHRLRTSYEPLVIHKDSKLTFLRPSFPFPFSFFRRQTKAVLGQYYSGVAAVKLNPNTCAQCLKYQLKNPDVYVFVLSPPSSVLNSLCLHTQRHLLRLRRLNGCFSLTPFLRHPPPLFTLLSSLLFFYFPTPLASSVVSRYPFHGRLAVALSSSLARLSSIAVVATQFFALFQRIPFDVLFERTAESRRRW
jgi:hypothetical protein